MVKKPMNHPSRAPLWPGRLLQRSSRRYLRRHPLLMALSIVGVALGVAVVVGIDLANTSARTAFTLSTETVAGRATHSLEASSRTLPDSVYRIIKVDEGFRDAAPVIEGSVRIGEVDGPVVQVLGVDPLAEDPFRSFTGGPDGGIDLGRFMGRSPGVLVAAATAERLNLPEEGRFSAWHEGQHVDLEVEALLPVDSDLDAASLENLIVVDIATAQRVLMMQGQLSRVDLILPEGTEAAFRANHMRGLPDNVTLEQSAGRSDTLAQMTEAFSLNLTAMSLLALVVGMFLIYNTMTFSVVQRRPLLGRLRAVGVTRREMYWMIISEALLVGLAGSILGVVGGLALGNVLVGLVTQTINDLYFVVRIRDLDVSAWSIGKGLAIGIGSTILSTLPPAREATRTAPSMVLKRSATETSTLHALPRLVVSGVVLAVAGVGILWLSGKSIAWSYGGILAIILAFACWIPPIVLLGARTLRPVLGRVFGIIGRMGASGIEQSLSRSAVAVAALTIAVASTTGVGVMVDSFRTTVNTWLTYALEADIYISPPGDVFRRNDATITAEAEHFIRSRPDVEAAYSVRTARVLIDNQETDLIVTEPRPRELEPGRYKATMTGDFRRAMQESDVVMVSEPYAFRYGTNVGDSLRIMTSHGPVAFRVGAIYYDYASDLGVVQMTRDRYDIHFDDPRVSGLAVYASDGTDLDGLIQDLREGTASVQSLNIRSNRDLRQASLDVFDQTFTVTTVLRLLAILVAFVGVLTALMALQLERSRELAVLRANGMTPGQVGRMITLQTSSMGLLAGLLSVPLGLVLAWLLIYVINQRSFGWTLQFEVDGVILLQAILLAVVAAALAAMYPSLSMSRTKASEALREE